MRLGAALLRNQPGQAFTNDGFRGALEQLSPPSRFAIAVSGGRDSMALACAARDYAARTGAEVHAFTVDHGLRVGSAEEAACVKSWCEALGLAHQTLTWEGEKPTTGIQATARSARYGLLAKAAENAKCAAILTAHTSDDQAETLFMRLGRGAGARGLSAMRDDVMIAAGPGKPVRLLRPMLGFSRASVTQFLKETDRPYLDDPSNDDPKFERVRARAVLAALTEQEILTGAALCETARKLQRTEEALRAREDELFGRLGGCFHQWGGISLETLTDETGTVGLVQRLIFAVGGGAHFPDEMAAQETVERLLAKTESGKAVTLAGAMVMHWRGRLWFFREAAALLGRSGVPPTGRQSLNAEIGAVVWDRRFIVRALGGPEGQIGPLGAQAATLMGPKTALFHGPPQALATCPGLFQGDVLIDAASGPFMASDIVYAQALTQERFAGEIIRFS